MKRLLRILLSSLLFTAGAAHAGGYVDMVLGGNQGSPTFISYRNANYAMHIGGIENDNGLPNGINPPAYEYSKPWDYPRCKWLRDVTGETWPSVPGTSYSDFSKPEYRAAFIRAEKKWCAQVQPGEPKPRLHMDCIMECPPGREDDAAALVEETAAAGFKVMPNNGDPYTAGITDLKTPWGRINKAASVVFIQVGIDLGNYNFSRFVYTCSVINYYVGQDKTIIVGVFDQDGKHAADALSFFGSEIFKNPLVFKHYNVSYLSTVNVGLQIPGGKPVTEPTIPTTPAQYGLNAPLGRSSLYLPSDNWFNLNVSKAPLDASSDAIIATIRSYESLKEERTLYLDAMADYGIPYTVVKADAPLYPVTFGNASESDAGWGGKIGYPIPAAAQTDTRYVENGPSHLADGDRHLLMYCPDTGIAYELSYASFSSGRWSAGYGAIFDTRSNYRRPTGWTSTSAGGMLVLAGLLRADEVFTPDPATPITHALRVSFRRTNGYVWPASHTGATDVGAPPLGLRLRMKASVDLSTIPQPYRKIFQAMKDYGLICDDRGGNMYLQGTMDARFVPATMRPYFQRFNASHFEVIQRGWGK